VGQERATRMMDNDPTSLAGSEPGQIQTLRQIATGSFPECCWRWRKIRP
jgi:hypothetical protein